MRFYSAVSTLTLCEMLLAPHHWCNNYITGFCDTWGLYLKAVVGRYEDTYPTAGYLVFDIAPMQKNVQYTMRIRPYRAQRHYIRILHTVPTYVHMNPRFFAKAKYRISMKHDGKVFYSSQWQEIKYFRTDDTSYDDRPFGNGCHGKGNRHAEIVLDYFDNSFFPWDYRDQLEITVELSNLKIDFSKLKAVLSIDVYNNLEM